MQKKQEIFYNGGDKMDKFEILKQKLLFSPEEFEDELFKVTKLESPEDLLNLLFLFSVNPNEHDMLWSLIHNVEYYAKITSDEFYVSKLIEMLIVENNLNDYHFLLVRRVLNTKEYCPILMQQIEELNELERIEMKSILEEARNL